MTAAHPWEFEVSRCITSQFARSVVPAQVRLWNDLPYTVFALERWMVPRVQSTVGCLPELCYLQFSAEQVLVWLQRQFINNIFLPTWACAAGFNNNNNNNDCVVGQCELQDHPSLIVAECNVILLLLSSITLKKDGLQSVVK